ncbi:hypothetical protein KC19_12G013400 [Ceratodon purpureus]|uniref:Uncharacterized protein n=1 Tax=Ceratodon purpureus TaxID=3225 RepID=A0A8T0G4R3_CERPU|nr:hypothetical protein KC19_12G013400 [Ceratodon purpureus]
MINCIVSRRLCQGRKAPGPRLIVPESPYPITPEFQNYFPEENGLYNRRLSLAYEGYGGGGAFPQQSGVFSLQGITVDGRLAMLDDGEGREKVSEPNQRPSRGDKMLSKHFVAPNARRNRRASLHGCELRSSCRSSIIDSDAVLHPKEALYLQRNALASNDDARGRNLSNGVAHISLDGRIMDAVSATSSAQIGGNLGEEEAQAWDCFAPLQRVLIVAVAAAAAASSKHKSHQEINRLQKAVNAQENALTLMRRELSNLWDQVATEENGPLSFMTPRQLDARLESRSLSPVTPVNARDAPNPETPMTGTLRPLKGEAKCDLSDGSTESCDLRRDDPVNKGVLLVESAKHQLQIVQSGDAKWYSNPLIEHSARSEDSTHSEHYFEDCTPEKRQRIFSRFTPDAGDPIEWMSVKSSFTTISGDAITPMTNRKRFSMEALPVSVDLESSDLGEMTALRARCAILLVEVKNQILSVLEKEASQVMVALSHVIEKAQRLEKMDRTSSLSRRVITPEKKAQASAALKQSVEKASAKVASLQAAVLSIWHTIGPHALASLNLSPRELESFLRRITDVKPETLMTKAGKQVSANDEGIQEWKQWLQAKHSESTVPSLLSKMEAAANPSFGDDQAVCSPSWRHKGSEISSAVGVAVRKTVDSLMAPLDGRKAAENFESPAAKQRVSSLSEDAPQFLAQQLLGELEKAAAKIAGMEHQMVSLKQSVRESEAQREKAELKLAEAIARDHQNQEKFEREMAELTTKLREKECAYDDLMRSRKVMFLVKSKEIAELKKECQRRDVALDDITAAAQATREASDQRLAVLEDICRRKDSAIQELKQEIIALEDQVHELELRSPLLLRSNGRRNVSFLRSSTEEAIALEDTFNGICREKGRTQASSLPHKPEAFQSNMDDTCGHPQSSCIFTVDTMDFCAQEVASQDPPAQNCRLDPPGNPLPVSCTAVENSTHLRASTYSLPSRAKEYSRSLAVSIDGSVFPSPTATLFDDFLEVESSLQALAADEGSWLSGDFCTSSNGDTLRCSQEDISSKDKPGSGLLQMKNMATGTVAESAGSNTKVSKSQLPRGKVSFSSTDENRKPSGVLRPTKASSLKAQGKSKARKNEKESAEPLEEEEIHWVNAEVLTCLEFNGSLNGSIVSRRTSNASCELKESIGKQTSKENKNIRRTRWH